MSRADRATLFQQIDRLYRGGAVAGLDDAQLLGRYVRERDESAFEALVERHGPLVLSLCRRLLRDPRDIEDAFQATFLVLAHRAGTIRNRAVLASWLYGVALRIATRCRSDVLRRRAVETSVDVLEFPAADSARSIDEIGPALDQELSRLPEKYRVPIILCYFKDQTHDQAAAELNWPVGTVRSRLARGRELLRSRLTRRGWAPADAMLGLGAGMVPRSFTVQVPRALVDAAVASAGRFTGGASAVGASVAAVSSGFSGPVPALAQGVIATMAATQYTWIASGITAFGLVAGGVVVGASALAPSGDGKPGQATAVVAKTVRSPAASAKAGETPAARAENLATTIPDDQPPPGNVAARLAELERKLDLLLRMQSPQPTPASRHGVSELPLQSTFTPEPLSSPGVAHAPEAVPGPAPRANGH
ncbi:MAG: sigma-70 family RNA polymerase sigma factor [Isosphaeraceae bacterium]